jgi:hypothetical protein
VRRHGEYSPLLQPGKDANPSLLISIRNVAGAEAAQFGRERIQLFYVDYSGRPAKAERESRKRIATTNRRTFILYISCVIIKRVPVFVFLGEITA